MSETYGVPGEIGKITLARRSSVPLERRFRVWLRRVGHFARSFPLARARSLRLAWLSVKRALRVPTGSDHAFLTEEFIRLAKARLVGSQCHITTERGDGAGAQAMAKMSAICLAQACNLTYVHEPFAAMEHVEGDPDEYAASWERLFNLGHGEIKAAECHLPRVNVEEFIVNPHWRTSPCLLTTKHFVRFTDQEPDAYLGVIQQLRTKYRRGSPSRPPSSTVQVCVHLRRGDVSADDPGTTRRFTNDAVVLNSIAQVRELLEELGMSARIRLFSQGSDKDFANFRDAGCELCLDVPARDTLCELVEADILVMSKSSFSYVAAILNDGVKLYDDGYARSPMSEWLKRDMHGLVDKEALRRQIASINLGR